MSTAHSNNSSPIRSKPSIVAATDLSVQILDATILCSIQFNLESGTITGLIGPNGCGKTTLLRAICGYLPYTGSILLNNLEIGSWPRKDLACMISFVRQAPSLLFNFTVEELVILGLLPHKSLLENISDQDLTSLKTALEQVGLSGLAKRSLQSLSGGERQRAYLAQALLQNSDLLLLDEPTNHLDICHQYQFLELMKSLTNQGKTILAVFHDLELAARFSDHLLVIKDGHIVTAGTPENILSSELLADVFRMQASVDISQNHRPIINYEASLKS